MMEKQNKLTKMFPITGVSRKDLVSVSSLTEEQVLGITDDVMEQIAFGIAESYGWNEIELLLEDLGVYDGLS